MRDLFDLLAEIEEDNADEPKLTLPILRKKYKGKTVSLDKLPEGECSFLAKSLELDWEFTRFLDWCGEEIVYNVTVYLNSNMTIKQIGTLQCRKYTGSDATSDGYKNKRADDFDYCYNFTSSERYRRTPRTFHKR